MTKMDWVGLPESKAMRKSELPLLIVAVAVLLAGPSAHAQVSLEAVLQLDTVPAEDLAAAVVDPEWEVPRTSWGHPNLEGIWTTDDMNSVPRERPEEFGLRATLTAAEFAERAVSDFESRENVLNRSSYSPMSVGSRTFGYTSQVIDPPNGRLPPMNATGLARARGAADQGSYGPGPFDTFEDLHLYDRCITRGIIGSASYSGYGNALRIVQSPDTVTIGYEMLAETRVIQLDGRPHAQENIRQYLGNSRGHWEGDTLVVETRNLTDKTNATRTTGVRHSTEMKITERLTRVDPEMIEYVATLDDPLTYTQPFTIRMMWTTQPGYVIYEYSCHEGNTAVRSSLGGEREYERRVQEAIARGETPPERIASQPGLDPLPDDESAFININLGEGN
jgi:hypothetical protein